MTKIVRTACMRAEANMKDTRAANPGLICVSLRVPSQRLRFVVADVVQIDSSDGTIDYVR